MRAIRWSYGTALAASLLVLAACSSGGGGNALPSAPGALPPAGSSTASGAQFTVSVARQTPQSANRKAASVSAGIASLVISATGTASASTTINVTAGSAGCTTTETTISCTGTINLVPGTYTFAVKEYDGANGTGNVLGTGSVSQALAPGALTNVSLTLNGIVNSVQLALNPTTLPSGTATSATLTVMALDASGNIIVAPGVYVDANGNPVTITVTTSGANGISLSAAQVSSAANAVLKVTYNGTALTTGTQALFNAAAGAATAKTVALTFTAPGTAAGSLYVVNNQYLQQYSADGNTLITQLFQPTYSRSIGYDGAGNLYVVGGSSLLVYPPGVGTSGTPLREIGGSQFSGANCFLCYGIPTVDSHGYVYNIELINSNNTIGAFSPTASGNVGPDKTWTISTVADQVSAVAADTDGNVYVASVENNGSQYAEIDVFPSSTPSGPVTPARSIILPPNQYWALISIGFDSAHNLYAYDNSSNTIVEVPAGTSGPYTPSTAFTDGIGGNYLVGFAVEPNGAVDVAFQNPQPRVEHFPVGSTGTVTPPTLQPGPGGFNYPSSLALSPSGSLSVLDGYTGGIYSYAAGLVAAGGSPAATTPAVASVPFGVGSVTSASVGPNGDLVVSGSGGPDAIDIYSAGTLALGTPVRSISSLSIGGVGGAFEDSNGYLYATATGMAGASEGAIARRPGEAVKRTTIAAATTTMAAASAKRRPASFGVNQFQIAIFAPGASGSALPVRSITASNPYNAATVGPDGTIYLVVPGAVLVYNPAANTPSRTISYVAYPGGSTVHAITVDASNWIYITDGTTIYTIAPGAATVTGTFPVTSPGANNPLLTTNGSNLYVAVAAGLESYSLSSVRAVGVGGTAPALNPGVLPIYDPAISYPYLFSAVFGN